jgi:PBSX family phage terminase large subunit
MTMALEPLTGKGLESYRRSTAAGNLWEGAVRSAKTVSSTVAWMDYVRHGPQGELLMIGKTERTLKRNVIDPMISYLGPRRCKYIAGAGEVRMLGRRIYVAGANDERSADKVQGMTLAGWYGDELSTWPKAVFDMARTRLSVPGAQWFGTSNPASPAHFLMTDIIDRAKLHLQRDGSIVRRRDNDALDAHVFSFTLDDNPWLSPTFVANLKKQFFGLFYRRYINGEWVQAAGAVYDMFDPALHVIKPEQVPPIRRWIAAGIDHGTRNPTHAVLIGLAKDINWTRGDPGEAALYVTSEWRYDSRQARQSLSDRQQSERLRAWLKGAECAPGVRGVQPEYTCVDPSAAGLRVQMWHDGLGTTAADNDVLAGIGTNASLFAQRKIYISTRAPELIKELPSYAWDDNAGKLGIDKVIKTGDHGCDALRYGDHTTKPIWHDDVYGFAAA